MSQSRLGLVVKRILYTLPVLFGVVVIAFVLTRASPGDPAVFFAGDIADKQSIEETRKSLGLDKSYPEQFLIYLKNLATGNLGKSLSTGQTVAYELTYRLPASLELTITALMLSIMIAVPLGILAATRPGSLIDHLCRFIVTAGVSLPTFFTGLALMFVFSYLLGWPPDPAARLDIALIEPDRVTGFLLIDSVIARDWEVLESAATQLVLPATTLALFTLAPIARMTRAAMIQALSSDYIRTARASGLSSRRVLLGYAFKNAMLPVVTTLGMVFSFALGANVLVEKVFAWPGIGSYAIEALKASDYAAVQGFVLSMAILFVFLNLVIDIIYTLIDPRIKIES